MAPETVHIPHFIVSGLSVHTTNHAEFNPATAKLPGLWGQFFAGGVSDKITNRQPKSAPFGQSILGVYSAYETDATGPYTVTAGVAVTAPSAGFSCIDINEGPYLAFTAKGPMPTTVIQTWVSIWAYFEQNPQVKRCFLTDFEAYSGLDEVTIHIGILP
ncbi:MAG: effector binding domain-containing protein [Alphaproteobacteria bacterium]